MVHKGAPNDIVTIGYLHAKGSLIKNTKNNQKSSKRNRDEIERVQSPHLDFNQNSFAFTYLLLLSSKALFEERILLSF